MTSENWVRQIIMEWQLKKYPMNAIAERRTARSGKADSPFSSKAALIGNLIYLSGVDATDIKTGAVSVRDFEGQMVGSLNNVQLVLEEVGSTLANVVKFYILVRNGEDCQRIEQIMESYYCRYAPSLNEEPPVVTVMPVKALSQSQSLVEIDTHAVLNMDDHDCEVKKYPQNNGGISVTSGLITVGNLVYMPGFCGDSSMTGKIETDNFETQFDTAFDKIMTALDRAGSSASNLIKTMHMQAGLAMMLERGRDPNVSGSPSSDRLWKRELEHFDMYAPYLMQEFPASTFLKLPSLPVPEAQVQLDYIGVLNRYRKGWEVKNYPLYLGRRGFPRHAGDIKKFYSNTVVIGNLINVSGQTATDPYTARIESDSFVDQLKVALDGMRFALEETGSTLESLAKTFVLLPDPNNYDMFRKVEREYYEKYAPALVEKPPASTIIYPLSLASTKMKIEIDAIGFLPPKP
jgi:enamine deaminase RidA (YjgF/YER057c/UK114 family)